MVRMLSVLLLALLSPLAQAEVANVYEFDTAEQEQRFQDLIVELRCPKCQNQNIADSNAPISKDMRAEVYRRMRAGASNDEIVDALLAAEGVQPPAPENPISPEEAKRVHIERFLERTDGNITKTAELLNMHRRTLQRILKRAPDLGKDAG